MILRLRTNQPLTETDLQGLERTLAEIGDEDGETLLKRLLARTETPSLAHFVRGVMGMDRAAAQAVFVAVMAGQWRRWRPTLGRSDALSRQLQSPLRPLALEVP